ncbi:MAG: translesion error-prone DNA polymerase V autoproteolytic subunit [Rhodoferax sp.]|nr:translesion error-prone DNA polymerase V autoproteolytic subunit [Rhodoferax sp.]
MNSVFESFPTVSEPTPLPQGGWPVSALDVRIAAGFPSPAEDHSGKRIDVLEHLVKHPQAPYQMHVRGESMREAGIFDGDVVLVDRAIAPRSGQIVVAVVDGEFTIKQLWQRAGRMKLKAANPTFADITPKEGQSIEVWGVVVASIKVHKT